MRKIQYPNYTVSNEQSIDLPIELNGFYFWGLRSKDGYVENGKVLVE